MNKTQRSNTSTLPYDVTRFAVVGVIFVNFVPGKDVSWWSILTGFIIAGATYAIAYWLDRKE